MPASTRLSEDLGRSFQPTAPSFGYTGNGHMWDPVKKRQVVKSIGSCWRLCSASRQSHQGCPCERRALRVVCSTEEADQLEAVACHRGGVPLMNAKSTDDPGALLSAEPPGPGSPCSPAAASRLQLQCLVQSEWRKDEARASISGSADVPVEQPRVAPVSRTSRAWIRNASGMRQPPNHPRPDRAL